MRAIDESGRVQQINERIVPRMRVAGFSFEFSLIIRSIVLRFWWLVSNEGVD